MILFVIFETVIIAKNISKSYGKLKVLNDINLEINQAEVVSIIGASGAGKSTLLQILGTLDKPDSGNLFINGVEITSLSAKQISDFRNKSLGFVFQFHHLLPEFTALENIVIPAMIGNKNMKEAHKYAHELAEFLNISQRLNHKPAELSGGEQQRVAVARALINNPAVVFADEPSGNLDSKNAAELHQLFFDLRNEYQKTFVIVTHNPDLAQRADRSLEMKDGQLLSNLNA